MHGEKRNVCRILFRKPEGKRPYEDLRISVRIIIKLIVEK
jgi:hypothetical protein